MLFSIGATEDTAWRRSAAAGSDRIIAGRGTYSQSSFFVRLRVRLGFSSEAAPSASSAGVTSPA
jgi:hypothetical protein